MSRYDQKQLSSVLAGGVTPLQSLSGRGGAIEANMAALDLQSIAPAPAPAAETPKTAMSFLAPGGAA